VLGEVRLDRQVVALREVVPKPVVAGAAETALSEAGLGSDHEHLSSPLEHTLSGWPSVRRGLSPYTLETIGGVIFSRSAQSFYQIIGIIGFSGSLTRA
jgi:hypothetical protein